MPCPDENQLAAFIAGALAGPALGRMEEHAAACSSCRTVIAESALAANGPPDDEAPALRRGDTAGRYVLLERAGTGAMGEVFAAWDPELARRVALKLLRVDGVGGAAGTRERLLAEARAMARLSHPSIVPVYDVGEARGRTFVAMEYVDGMTLRDWAARGSRDWREVVRIYAQAGAGLAAAHAAGLVHRDFKPENVLIGVDGAVRVTDFGLARALAPQQLTGGGPARTTVAGTSAYSAPEQLTGSGAGTSAYGAPEQLTGGGPARSTIAGTPAYMAPEQLTGGEVDGRSDQYSFCVALYEALAGERPFRAEDERALLEQKLRGLTPDRLERAAGPARVRRALARGLSPAPKDRFPTMAQLLSALSAPRRRWALLGAAALGAGALLVSAALAARKADPQRACVASAARVRSAWGPAQREAGRLAFERAGGPQADFGWKSLSASLDAYAGEWAAQRVEACEATHARGVQSAELMDRRLACLDTRLEELRAVAALVGEADAKVVARWPRLQALTPLRDCAAASLLLAVAPPPPEQREAVQQVRAALAGVPALLYAGRFPQARKEAEAQRDTAKALGYLPLVAEALLALRMTVTEQGEVAAHRDVLEEALLAAEASGDTVLEAKAWTHLAAGAVQDGQPAEGLKAARRARALLQRLKAPPPLTDAHVHNVTGVLLRALGRHEEAIAELRAGIAAMEDLPAVGAERARSLANLGNALLSAGQVDAAKVELDRAVSVSRAALGEVHPDVGGHVSNLATWDLRVGRLEDARAHLSEALGIFERATGGRHPSVGVVLNNLGALERLSGRYPQALEYLERAVALRKELLGPRNPAVGTALSEQARALAGLGRFAEAHARHREALALLEGDTQRASALMDQASTFGLQRQWGSAHGGWLRARELLEKLGPSADLALCLTGLGEAELELGRVDAARTLLERALSMAQARSAERGHLAGSQFQLARALAQSGEGERALALAREALRGSVAAPVQARVIRDWLRQSGAEP